jgi:hypothetical protein
MSLGSPAGVLGLLEVKLRDCDTEKKTDLLPGPFLGPGDDSSGAQRVRHAARVHATRRRRRGGIPSHC